MRAISSMLIGLMLSAAASAADGETFSKQVPAERSGRVYISNVAGSVKVTAWDRPEIDVQAQLDSGVERVDVTRENGGTVIKVVLPQNWHRDGRAMLEVRIPGGSQLEASTVSASIVVDGIRGKSRLQSVSGDIRTDVADADVEVKTVSGSIDLRGSGQPARIRASTVSGSVSLTQGAGELEAHTTSGRLDVAVEPARSVRVSTISGSLKFHGRLLRGAILEAQTISGGLFVEATSEDGYQYDVSTFSGSIHNCFGENAVRTNQYTPGSRLSGARNAGKGNVRLQTLSGSVDLCDR